MNADDALWLEATARRLDRLRAVPDSVLIEIALRDCTCSWVFEDVPSWQDENLTDRQLAARLCAGCPAQDECLELELRVVGRRTVGVCGGLCQDDRRALYPIWLERGHGSHEGGDQ